MAIHKIKIDSFIELAALKKLFRKKLMTGGAVLELSKNLDNEQLHQLFDEAKKEVQLPGVARLLLIELAELSSSDEKLLKSLHELEVSEIDRTLYRRSDLPSELAASIKDKGHIRTLEEDHKQTLRVETYSFLEQRNYFLGSLGDEKTSVSKRLALLKAKSLPTDLLFLLRRDPNSEVRFVARSYES